MSSNIAIPGTTAKDPYVAAMVEAQATALQAADPQNIYWAVHYPSHSRIEVRDSDGYLLRIIWAEKGQRKEQS